MSTDSNSLALLETVLKDVGFLTLVNTGLSARRVAEVISAYRMFFDQDRSVKAEIDMAKTGGNRGWGAG